MKEKNNLKKLTFYEKLSLFLFILSNFLSLFNKKSFRTCIYLQNKYICNNCKLEIDKEISLLHYLIIPLFFIKFYEIIINLINPNISIFYKIMIIFFPLLVILIVAFNEKKYCKCK